ncbi:DUF6221 family protein [Nocardia transvalensis]|uniref:DUF6221 family protein n=1 Tax=Nocardia transvalensis TaxID=37333 RepID=UPI0018943087|nr:DUF6221 family protein [Nocardia transvalensis]MBF6332398.1 hypothetical protein [Nocardia transvalensis]
MTIEEFIEARLAEDEQIAQAAAGAPWSAPMPPWVHVEAKAIAADKERLGHLGYVGTIDRDIDRTHVIRHDPAHVLRQCAALRTALKTGKTTKEIAAIWSDHSDYEPGWMTDTE